MIMEFQDSATITQRLQEEAPVTYLDCLIWCFPLWEALKQAHEQGLFHGNIQPENILIANNAQPLLVGFSVLSVAELSDSKLRPTENSDLYQLAAIMYQYIRKQKSVALPDRLAAIQKGKKDPLEPLQNATDLGAISQRLLTIIDDMLSLDENWRPKTARKAHTKTNEQTSYHYNFYYHDNNLFCLVTQ